MSSSNTEVVTIWLVTNPQTLENFSYRILKRLLVIVMTHRPSLNSMDVKNSTEKLKQIPLEHSEIHFPSGSHSNNRQDIGKVSQSNFANFVC